MNWLFLRHPRRLWALVLALALLLLSAWGQVHRVLHPGVSSVSALAGLAVSAHTHDHHDQVHGLGHDSSGSLCLLLDHLADGPSVTVAPQPFLTGKPTAELPRPTAVVVTSGTLRSFDARAPPEFA